MKILLKEGILPEIDAAEATYDRIQNHLNEIWQSYGDEVSATVSEFLHYLQGKGIEVNPKDYDIVVDLTEENSGVDMDLIFSKDFPNNDNSGGKIIINVGFIPWMEFLETIPVILMRNKNKVIKQLVNINKAKQVPKSSQEFQLLDSLFLDTLSHFRDLIHAEYIQKLNGTPTDPQTLRKAIYTLRSVDGFTHDVMDKFELAYSRAIKKDTPLTHDIRKRYMKRIHKIYNELVDNLT